MLFSWSERITQRKRGKPTFFVRRKAAVLETQRRVDRTPPGSKSGACTHKGSLGTRENRHLLAADTGIGKPEYKNGQALTGELSCPEGERTKVGERKVSGNERKAK